MPYVKWKIIGAIRHGANTVMEAKYMLLRSQGICEQERNLVTKIPLRFSNKSFFMAYNGIKWTNHNIDIGGRSWREDTEGPDGKN